MKLPKWVEEAAAEQAAEAYPIPWDCRATMEVNRENYREAFLAGAALVLERLEKTRETEACFGTIACHDDSYHSGRESVRKEVRGE